MDTNVNEGTMISSPGWISKRSAAISKAWVQDVVRSTFVTSNSDSNKELQNLNVTVLGVSPDDEDSHQQFTNKFDLNFPLLADPGAELAKTYGAWGERERQGKIIVGILRTTFAIDENGYISNIWQKVSPEGHAKEIIDWVKEN